MSRQQAKQNPLTGLFNKLGLGNKNVIEEAASVDIVERTEVIGLTEIRGLDDLFPNRVGCVAQEIKPPARPESTWNPEMLQQPAIQPSATATAPVQVQTPKKISNNDILVVAREAKAPIPQFQQGVLTKVRWPGTEPPVHKPMATSNQTARRQALTEPPVPKDGQQLTQEVESFGAAWVTTGSKPRTEETPVPQPVIPPATPQQQQQAKKQASALDTHIAQNNRNVNHSINNLVERYFASTTDDDDNSISF